jgi:predicted Zn-dependent protease
MRTGPNPADQPTPAQPHRAEPSLAAPSGGPVGGSGRLVAVVASMALLLVLCIVGLVLALAGARGGATTHTTASSSGSGGAGGAGGAGGGGGGGVKRDDAAQAALDSARVLVQRGDFAAARALVERVAPTFPNDQDLRLTLAQALIGEKKFPEAYAAMKDAIAIGPALPSIHFDAGTVANQAGLLIDAERHYTLAQKGDPTNPLFPLYLAMVQIKQGQDLAATASLLRVVKLDESIAEAWGTLGELQLKADRPGVAADQFARAMRLQPTLARWRVGAARAALKQGDKARAEGLIAGLDDKSRSDPTVQAVIAEIRGE